MDINKRVEDGSVTLAVTGSLNTATARDLERVVDDALVQVRNASLTFDFSGLEYIS